MEHMELFFGYFFHFLSYYSFPIIFMVKKSNRFPPHRFGGGLTWQVDGANLGKGYLLVHTKPMF